MSVVDAEQLRSLFTKPYGVAAPTEDQWRELYDEAVHFQDPTQERDGIKAYIEAQDGLMRRCDDVLTLLGWVIRHMDLSFGRT